MSKFSKRGIKTILLLSCSSVLASSLEAPLVYAAESIINSQQSNVAAEESKDIVHREQQTISFVAENMQENSQTELLEMQPEDTALEGTTTPLSIVRIIFAEQPELVIQADEEGKFVFEDFLILDETFELIIEDEAGEVLETLTYTVELVAETVEEEVEAPSFEEVEEPLEEEPVTEEPVEEETVEEVVEEAPVEEVEEEINEPVEVEEEKAEEVAPVQEKQMQTFSTFSTRTAAVEKKGTTYYYVKAGDNLKAIADSFKVTVDQMMKWNNITNANLIKVGDIISVNGTNDYHNYNRESKTFANSREFINYVSRYAKEIGANYDLYASIMIAQAALETGYGTSDLGSKANNLFGIKTGDGYDGYSIVMRTWEVVNGQKVYEDAYFRLYPSFYDSFIDYAEKLRNGKFMWDKNFYQGTWVENTGSFKDATLFLTGRYATDPRYYYKLNSIILANGLHQYDEKPYSDQTYDALVTKGNYPIGNVPFDQVLSNNYWYSNIKEVNNTKNLLGSFVEVTHVTRNGQYANIYGYNASNQWVELGWVHTDALTTINLNIVNANHEAYFTSANSNIHTLPLGQAGTAVAGKTSNYLNQKLQVTSQTADGAQSYVTLNGQALGWVLTADLGQTVSPYSVTIVNGAYNVDNVPWGNPGFRKLANTSAYMGTELQVVGSSHNGSYLLLSQNGKAVGWVDKRAVRAFTYTPMNTQAYVTGGAYNIDSLPWGEIGFKTLGKTSQYLGKIANITKESANKAYVFVTIDGKNVGWIDKRALNLQGDSYEALVVEGRYSVDSLPWGTPGFKNVGFTKDYIGEMVQILGATQDGKYLLMQFNGKTIGWVDYKAVQRYKSIPVEYAIHVTSGAYEIDTLPWGEPGFKKLGITSSILGKKVTVTRESMNRAYAYVITDGKPTGWIDKKALGFKSDPYKAVVSEGGYEINTLPWGTPGFKRTGYTRDLLGKQLEVVGSTQNGAYLLVSLNGKEVGWIDHRAMMKQTVTPMNYTKKVTNGKYDINNLPWGVGNYRLLGKTSSLVGKTVQVTLESSNKAYVFVFENGNPIGWIDKRAFN